MQKSFKFLLKEDQTLSDSNRQTTSVGPGATDSPFDQTDISKANPETPMGNTTAPKVLPFQIEKTIQEVGDIYIKLCELRAKFTQASTENPSLEPYQQNILDRIIKHKIDKANKIIISIPEMLNDLFE
jgi:hypothetical protein